MNWVTQSREGASLCVRVVPRASRNELSGPINDSLKIRLQAPPVEGKANRALVKFLAKALGVATGHVVIVSGANARHKRVQIKGMTEAECVSRLTVPGHQKDAPR